MAAPVPQGTLLFHCPHCASPLSVPTELGGSSGPCPRCARAIQAPRVVGDNSASVPANQPAARKNHAPSSVHLPPVREEAQMGGKVISCADPREALGNIARGFFPKRSIAAPAGMAGKDDSWKQRYRERSRKHHKQRKRDKLLDSVVSIKSGVLIALVFTCVMGFIAYKHHGKRALEDSPRIHRASGGLFYQMQTPAAVAASDDSPDALIAPGFQIGEPATDPTFPLSSPAVALIGGEE